MAVLSLSFQKIVYDDLIIVRNDWKIICIKLGTEDKNSKCGKQNQI